MGHRIRLEQPWRVYSSVTRCVDRQFLLKPNHHPKHPLISSDTPFRALDPRNDIIPKPSIINIIGSSFARAKDKYPVRLHWLESNINHLHIGVSETAEQLGNFAPFFRTALSLVSRQVNAVWEREGHLWAARRRTEPCIDDRAAEQQLGYALTNVVKDGLVERVSESPFFSTFGQLARGEKLEYWHIDWEGWWKAGGPRKKSHRVKDYLRWMELELDVLPGWEGRPEHERRTRVRCMCRDGEKEAAEARRAGGHRAMGVSALRALDPRDRPRKPKEKGRQPLCHASEAESRREYEREWREFLHEHRAASAEYRAGDFEREFPEGSYRPPLVTIYTSSRL